jgi:hypothetical protein
MTSISRIGEHQYKAFIDRISHSMLFTLHVNSGSRVSVGTGFLVSFAEHTYIVSALHNFTLQGDGSPDIIRSWNETRFKFRDAGALRFRERVENPEAELLLVPGIQLAASRPPLIDRRFDIIAVHLEAGEVLSNEVYPIELEDCIYNGEIRPGASLITVGMPYAGRVSSPHGKTVFYPHTDHVQHDPNIDDSNLRQSYSPEDHLLYHYGNHLDGIDPGGYSGAPVWSSYDVDQTAVWSARPAIVGIALRYYRNRNLLEAVRIKHLPALLEADRPSAETPSPAVAS